MANKRRNSSQSNKAARSTGGRAAGRSNTAQAQRERNNDERTKNTRSKGGAGAKQANKKTRSTAIQGSEFDLLEGRNALAEALSCDVPIEALYVSDAAYTDKRASKLIEKAQDRGAKLVRVDASELDRSSSHGAHQGIIARMKPYNYASLADLIAAAQDKENALIIATDHVTDAGNFGAIVRTAEVVGACGVLIPNKRNARVNTAAYKTSAGAVMHLPIAMEANLARSLEVLKQEGFWVAGASEHASDVVWQAPLSGRLVLVMGSEGDGLSRLTLENCDMLVKLPQEGKVESLNVAQACTALSYEWKRQCWEKGQHE